MLAFDYRIASRTGQSLEARCHISCSTFWKPFHLRYEKRTDDVHGRLAKGSMRYPPKPFIKNDI